MNEAAGPPGASAPGTAPTAGVTAGRLLREARERQGLHIAALAASIKVTQKKLEALEADRFGELPDATFTRALAQTVCRALKVDSSEIMRLLPPPAGHRLEQVGEGLNAPFRARPGALVQRDVTSLLRSPAFWITGLVLLAALVVYLLPGRLAGLTGPARSASAVASSASASSGAAQTVAVQTVLPRGELPGMPPDTKPEEGAPVPVPANLVAPMEPADAAVSAASSASASMAIGTAASTAVVAPSTTAASSILQVQATGPSWVEVNDARGQALLARLVKSGETVAIDGAAPFKVRVGNAAGTRLTFRGQPVELAASTRDNIARLELR